MTAASKGWGNSGTLGQVVDIAPQFGAGLFEHAGKMWARKDTILESGDNVDPSILADDKKSRVPFIFENAVTSTINAQWNLNSCTNKNGVTLFYDITQNNTVSKIVRTADGGKTFSNHNVYSGNKGSISHITADPVTGTFYRQLSEEVGSRNRSFVYRSTDGVNWFKTQIFPFVDEISSMHVGLNFVYAYNDIVIVIVPRTRSRDVVFRSTNGGVSFSLISSSQYSNGNISYSSVVFPMPSSNGGLLLRHSDVSGIKNGNVLIKSNGSVETPSIQGQKVSYRDNTKYADGTVTITATSDYDSAKVHWMDGSTLRSLNLGGNWISPSDSAVPMKVTDVSFARENDWIYGFCRADTSSTTHHGVIRVNYKTGERDVLIDPLNSPSMQFFAIAFDPVTESLILYYYGKDGTGNYKFINSEKGYYIGSPSMTELSATLVKTEA